MGCSVDQGLSLQTPLRLIENFAIWFFIQAKSQRGLPCLLGCPLPWTECSLAGTCCDVLGLTSLGFPVVPLIVLAPAHAAGKSWQLPGPGNPSAVF